MTSDVLYWVLVRGEGKRSFSLTITKEWWDELNEGKAFIMGFSRDAKGLKGQWFRFLSARELITPTFRKTEVEVIPVGEPWVVEF